jgi:hypothetical protein
MTLIANHLPMLSYIPTCACQSWWAYLTGRTLSASAVPLNERCICGDIRATFAEPHLTLAQPLIRVLAWFSHAASQFITPPYFGDLGPKIICTAWGCSNSRCGMATRVAETPGVVFQIRLGITCPNVHSRLMGMCFRKPLEKSLHHASINSGRLGQLHTIVQPRAHSSVAPLL